MSAQAADMRRRMCRSKTAALASPEFHNSSSNERNHKMSTNLTGYDERVGAGKEHVPGVGPTNDPIRLLDTLERLGIVSPEMAKPLKTIAACGKVEDCKAFLEVSVHRLDAALRKTTASTEQKMGLKASLARLDWLAPIQR
jgi:hypothetical protein